MLRRLDALVAQRAYPSRSQAVEAAIEEMLAHLEQTQLAAECAKLDPRFERALAEERLSGEPAEWPEY